MKKSCPNCKIDHKHERGHGDHIIICSKCNIKYYYQCLFIFIYKIKKDKRDKRGRRYSNPEDNIISEENLHYKYSNCSRICDEHCNCDGCFICSLNLSLGYNDHCGNCFSKICEKHNDYPNKIKKFNEEFMNKIKMNG
jgi:hypothetical protein